MIKKIALAVSVVGLAAAVPAVLPASAAPTQSGTLTCSKTGYTSFTSNGAVANVKFEWYQNSTELLTDKTVYSSPFRWLTPTASAKTAKATVTWQGMDKKTTYGVACK